jgi:hypothetical protein
VTGSTFFGRNPVDILNLLKGVLGLLTFYGVSITQDQKTSLIEVAGYVLVLVVGGAAQRSLVTPVAAPQLPKGTVVTVTPTTASPTPPTVTL